MAATTGRGFLRQLRKNAVIGLLFFLTITLSAQAQTLTGTVLDAKSKEPLASANVHLDGTTIGTVTDSDGRFRLPVSAVINTVLVISFVGYETVIIREPFKMIPDTVYLEEKDHALGEVSVSVKPPFSRAQKLRAFRRLLLGDTPAGYSCQILNEDDIKLIYDPDKKTLSAYADVPLQIKNKYLKYNIRWEIISFNVQYKKTKTLNEKEADLISILGLASFEDYSKKSRIVSDRREAIYRFSSQRFFRLLAGEDINGSDFRLFENENTTPIEADSLFAVKNDSVLLIRKVALIHPNHDNAATTVEVKNIFIKGISDVTIPNFARLTTYNKQYITSSRIRFLTDFFGVDSYGNTDLLDKVIINGYMGQRRLGDQLPLDYMPSKYFEETLRMKNVQKIEGDMIYEFKQ